MLLKSDASASCAVKPVRSAASAAGGEKESARRRPGSRRTSTWLGPDTCWYSPPRDKKESCAAPAASQVSLSCTVSPLSPCSKKTVLGETTKRFGGSTEIVSSVRESGGVSGPTVTAPGTPWRMDTTLGDARKPGPSASTITTSEDGSETLPERERQRRGVSQLERSVDGHNAGVGGRGCDRGDCRRRRVELDLEG
eukprot:1118555-Rhodomonas_salina.1